MTFEVIELASARQLTVQSALKERLVVAANQVLAEAEAIDVDAPSMRDLAVAEINAAKLGIKRLDEHQAECLRELLAEVEANRDIYRQPKAVLAQAVDRYEQKVIAFNREQQRLREAEQERLAVAARKEQARLREEAAAAAAKAEAEAKELREKAEAERLAGNAGKAAALESRAEAKIEAGETKAQVLTELADVAPIAPVLAAAPKMNGAHETVRWDIEDEIDVLELAKYVVANPMYANLLMPNKTALVALVRSLKKLFAIPGVKAKQNVGLTRSRAA